MNVAPEIREALAAHAAAVEAFVTRAHQIPDAAWPKPREAGKWSPCEETIHLILTYRAYGKEVANGRAVTPDVVRPRTPEARDVILPRILKGGWFPRGATSPEAARPDTAVREKELALLELNQSSEEFSNAVVEAVSNTPGRHVPHPYLGALTLTDLVVVLTEHARHHAQHLPVVDHVQML